MEINNEHIESQDLKPLKNVFYKVDFTNNDSINSKYEGYKILFSESVIKSSDVVILSNSLRKGTSFQGLASFNIFELEKINNYDCQILLKANNDEIVLNFFDNITFIKKGDCFELFDISISDILDKYIKKESNDGGY